MRISKMIKYFHKFSQLIFKETYGDQSRELVQSNFHYQPPLHKPGKQMTPNAITLQLIKQVMVRNLVKGFCKVQKDHVD